MSTAVTSPERERERPMTFAKASGSRKTKDQIARILVWAAFLLALCPLAWILYDVLTNGAKLLLDVDWWTHSQRGIRAAKEGGGANHAIVGTLLQALVTAVISVPIGVFTAIYLVEYGRGRLARAVSFMVDILTGVPSIVAALFVFAMWVTTFGFKKMPFAVCLALMLLMIPTIVRSTEEMLKLVPNELREASYALGVPKWKTITSIVLPTAFSGIVTGVLLGLARIMGETAPLIVLAPYTKSISTNLFGDNMATLPTMINDGRGDIFIPAAHDRVWAAAATLIVLVLLLNLLGRLAARFGSVKS